nr:hypothetical protein [Bacteroidales bacterium]
NQDKHIKVKLEQNIDTLEFMSLNISTTDAYQNFNADYGVLVGRVIANNGIGIPNAKISIFIPLTDEDANNSDIYSVYPYKTPRDKNNEGKRYNLLPRVSEIDPNTTIVTPLQPFGSFPIKEEVVGNKPFLDVYKKYYKYTALTNNAGDYMIFGVPTGTQIVHLSLDITDIGEYSMTPAAMVVNLGYSPSLFTDNNTKIKPSKDLNDLPHIETQEISVDIIPFWGDVDNFEIGITRQDFRVRAELINTFTIFGNIFTDNYKSRWAANWVSDNEVHAVEQLYRINNGDNIDVSSKRITNVTETIYYYPNNISDTEIAGNGTNLASKMLVLDKSQYTVHKNKGEFVFIINCNRKKIIKNENGDPVEVNESYNGGVYTEFKGFITLEFTEEDLPTPNRKYDNVIGGIINNSVTIFRTRIKIPQHAPRNQDFSYSTYAPNWSNKHHTFKANNIYSVAKFNGLVANTSGSDTGTGSSGFENSDTINKLQQDPYWNVGIIRLDDDADFPSNGNKSSSSTVKLFGSNWLNFSIYLPNIGYVKTADFGSMRTNSYFQRFSTDTFSREFTQNNENLIAGTITNNKWFLRSDLHWTDFIEVPKSDIKILNNFNKKGFDTTDSYLNTNNLIGDYRNGETPPSWGGDPCPINGGGENGNPVTSTNLKDIKFYFYKGIDTADCIKFVASVLNVS